MSKKPKQILHNIHIQKIGHGGVGIATQENKKKIIVKGNNIPGSTITCQTIKRKKDFIEAQLIEIKQLPEGLECETPRCPHYFNPVNISPLLGGEGLGVRSNDTPLRSGCGGCKRQMLPYSTQLQLKMDIFLDSFRSCTQALEHTHIHDIIAAPSAYHYRNKIEFSFGKFIVGHKQGTETPEDTKEMGGEVCAEQRNCGFHKQGTFSKVIDVQQCFLISQKAHTVFAHIKNLCKESGLPVHDQKIHTGFFRHIVIREGYNTNHILVHLVVADKELHTQHAEEQRTLLQKAFTEDSFLKQEVTTFCISHNNGLADIVKSTDIQTKILRGDGYIHEKLCFTDTTQKKAEEVSTQETIIEEGQMRIIHTSNTQPTKTQQQETKTTAVSFRISPFSFFQTNTYGAEILYQTAIAMAGEVHGTILDLYCGTGSIGISFLKCKKGNFVLGVEIVEEAILDAHHNAQINGVEAQTYFVAGKAEDLVHTDPTVQQKLHEVELIIIDPPRDGMHKNVITFLNTCKKQQQCKLLYVSCNPVTMARDIQLLSAGGRKLHELQPVDMFPQTHHIETIGIFS